MKTALVFVLVLASCATPEKIRFDETLDPAWAARVYRICEERHGANIRAYNRCVLDFAQDD